ncbi:MAG: hydrogenase maturation protease [Sterolibacterium sp.]
MGNRQVQGDDFGPRVYDCLAALPVPMDVDIVDGGLAGLGLLPYLEDGRRVFFVDAVAGFTAPGRIVLLAADEVARQCTSGFDHAAGLPYLLKVMPAVLDSPPPTVTVIGHEGAACAQAVRTAARLALHLATQSADDACRA